MNWLLIIIIGLLALYIVVGYKKGLLKMLYEFAAWLAILLLVTFATPYVCNYIKEHTNLETAIENSSREKISEIVISATEEIKIPKAVAEIIAGEENMADSILESTGIYESISSEIASLALMGLSFIICLLILIIVSKLLSKILDKVNHVPVIGTANRFFGMLLGAVKGITIVWTVFAIVAFNATSDISMFITSYVYESELLVWVYENNLIVNIMMKIWK